MCYILHNICEEKGHTVLTEEASEESLELPDPPYQDVSACTRNRREEDAVRNAIADFLMNGL